MQRARSVISESSWARSGRLSSWRGLVPPSTSSFAASQERRGWPACAGHDDRGVLRAQTVQNLFIQLWNRN